MEHPRPGLKYVDADDLDKSAFDFDGIEVVDPVGEKLGVVDGFIIDVNQARPYHVVVEAGHWYKHKHFLLPIGHVSLEAAAKRLVADVPRARAERFPGFRRSEFEQLTDQDLALLASSLASACADDVLDTSTTWVSWTDYKYPSWWNAGYYRPGRADAAARSAGAATPASANASPSTKSETRPSAAAAGRDRELVTARGGDVSPHDGGRAQPGDVIGVETGGEQTHIGDTAEDEDKVRRDAEKAAAKRRD
jgi:PRC-barrel domain protein